MNWQYWHCMSSACKKQPEKRRIWATQHGKMGQNDWLQVPKTSKNQIRLTIIKLTIIIQECQEKSERVSAYLDISEIWLTINGIQEILRVSTSHASSTLRIISEIYHVWTINCINSNSLGSRVAIINSTILSTSPFTMFAHSPNGYWCPSAHAGRPAAIARKAARYVVGLIPSFG